MFSVIYLGRPARRCWKLWWKPGQTRRDCSVGKTQSQAQDSGYYRFAKRSPDDRPSTFHGPPLAGVIRVSGTADPRVGHRHFEFGGKVLSTAVSYFADP